MLPKVVADFIHEGAAALGCDGVYIALPLLAVLASAVGNSRCIRLKRTWCEPAMIWAVVVGESGTLKSPAHDLAMKPIHQVQNTALKQYIDAEESTTGKRPFMMPIWASGRNQAARKVNPTTRAPAEPVAVR